MKKVRTPQSDSISMSGRLLPRGVQSGLALADILSVKDVDHNLCGKSPASNRSYTPQIGIKPPSPSSSGSRNYPGSSAESLINCVLSGELEKVEVLLQMPNLAVNYRKDGYSALELAVLNQEEEIFAEILRHPDVDVDHALVLAVTMGCSSMVEEILAKVKIALAVHKNGNKADTETQMTQKKSRYTELIKLALTEATQQDKWAIVETLLHEDYRLTDLDNLHYGETEEGMGHVELVLCRLSEYQIVCSPVYLALDKEDPILTAFIYSKTLQSWRDCFSAFKWQFEALADQVDQFAVDLLSQCRDTAEVELLLQAPKDENDTINKRHKWARLSLAISFQQRTFVANPVCQHVVQNTWTGGLNLFMCDLNNITGTWLGMLTFCLFFLGFVAFYPIIPIVYWCFPRQTTLYKKSRIPCVKLMSELAAYLWFLFLVLTDTFLGRRDYYGEMYLSYVITVWIFALLLQKLCLYLRVRKYFFVFWVNVYDVLMGLLYLFIFTLEHNGEFYTTFVNRFVLNTTHAHSALRGNSIFGQMLLNQNATLACQSETALEHEDCRFLRPWMHYSLVAESCLAIFSMMACLRLLYLFQITAFFGPMQVSLVRMIKDIVRFFIMFAIVLLSFAVGLYTLYSSYKGGHIVEDGEKKIQDETFVSFRGTMKALFWSLFGLIDLDVADMIVGQYNVTYADNRTELVTVDHYLNEALGYFLWGIYHLVAILVLLNILIATMNESFQRVQNNADAEWKFARTQVYLLYMEPGGTMPPPFNLVPSPTWIYRVLCLLKHKLFCKSAHPPQVGGCCRVTMDEKEKYEDLNTRYLELVKTLVRRYRKLHEQKVKTAEAGNVVATPLLSAKKSTSFFNLRRRVLTKKSCSMMDGCLQLNQLPLNTSLLPGSRGDSFDESWMSGCSAGEAVMSVYVNPAFSVTGEDNTEIQLDNAEQDS